jgi:hypothetical protein
MLLPKGSGLGWFKWVTIAAVGSRTAPGEIGNTFPVNAILRVGPMMSSNTASVQTIARVRCYAGAMAISGTLVLLLTALAQIE